MAKKSGAGGVPVKVTNREVWEAFEAIGGLVSRGWGDAKVALALGRTSRSLRNEWEKIDQARKMLLKEYGEVDKSGEVKMKDPIAFGAAWKELLKAEVELEIWPISVTALGSRTKACETCHRGPLDDIPAMHLETLVFLGAVTEDGSTT